MDKYCKKCDSVKDTSEFGKGNDKDGLSYICLECDRLRGKEYRNSNPEKFRESLANWKKNNLANARFYWIKSRAKTRDIPFDFSVEEFVNWYNSQRQCCVYCGVEGKLSVDRIIPSLGYTKGNIVLACIKCNLIKSDILSYEEMKEIAEKYIKPKLICQVQEV